MAVSFGDPKSGFSHREVINFINAEVLINGGGSDFYATYSSLPWNQVEDQLRLILANPRKSRSYKRACAMSALALSVRATVTLQEQQQQTVRQLKEKIAHRQLATWALSSQLQLLREEREEMLLQLDQTREDLRQSMDQRNELRVKLRQAEMAAPFRPQPEEVDHESGTQQQWDQVWPQHAETKGVMETEAAGEVSSQMPPGSISVPDLWATEGLLEELAPLCDQSSHVEEEGALSQKEMTTLADSSSHGQEATTVRPNVINPSGCSWSQGESEEQPGEQKTCPPKDPGTLHDAGDTQASKI